MILISRISATPPTTRASSIGYIHCMRKPHLGRQFIVDRPGHTFKSCRQLPAAQQATAGRQTEIESRVPLPHAIFSSSRPPSYIIRPSSSIMTREHSASISCKSWVVSKIVVPCSRFISFRNSRISVFTTISRPIVGSSRNKIDGLCSSEARARSASAGRG